MHWAAALCPIALAIAPLFAQPAPLVRLDVSAVDSHGRPVEDLQPDEVRILDDGQPQTPVFFQHWEQRGAGAVRLKPGEFANRPGHGTCVVVILNLLDNNTQRLQINQTLRAIGNDPAFCLYALHNQSGALQPIRPLPGASLEQIDPNLPALAPRRQHAPPIGLIYNSAYSALDAIGSQLAQFPGRKSIVWIGSMPLYVRRSDWVRTPEGRAMADKMSRLFALFEAADAAVYSVAVTPLARAVSSPRGITRMVYPDAPNVAGSTGGGSYIDQIDKAIADSMAATRSGYRLFYAAPDSARSTPYHLLKLICERRGATLTGKQGYDASLVTEPRTARDVLDAWTAAPSDATAIGMRATVAPAGAGRMRLDLSLDPADLLFDHGRAAISIQVVDYTTDGRPLTEGDPKQIELPRDAVQFPIEAALNGAVTKVRVIVCDHATHLAGTLTIPLTAVGDGK